MPTKAETSTAPTTEKMIDPQRITNLARSKVGTTQTRPGRLHSAVAV
jgi:hypothetical protein